MIGVSSTDSSTNLGKRVIRVIMSQTLHVHTLSFEVFCLGFIFCIHRDFLQVH